MKRHTSVAQWKQFIRILSGGIYLMKIHTIDRPGLVRVGAILILAITLSACAQMHNINSPFYEIPSGSKLILNQELNVPAGKAHINLQNGQVVAGLDNWNVGCQLEVRDLGPGVVSADTFTIRRAEFSQNWINRPNTMRYYRTLYLQSDNQPNVMQMVCQFWSYPLEAHGISVSEMRTALGSVATLDFAQ
jgi:hypothetical protein